MNIKKTKKQSKVAPQQVNKPNKKDNNRKKNRKKDSLIPFLMVIIVLLVLICTLSFSDNFTFLNDLLPKNRKKNPVIERPQIEHTDLEDTSDNKENRFAVTTEVEIKSETPPVIKENPAELPKSIKSRLFYVKVSDDGQISLKSVIRTVYYESKPLTETIKSLFTGPKRAELNKGYMNLIPQKSELLSIVDITHGIAYLNFNEEYRFNSLGFEGYKAQLMQTVYTATEFPTVNKVQILINGKEYDYLGAEGFYIGKPIGREYFN